MVQVIRLHLQLLNRLLLVLNKSLQFFLLLLFVFSVRLEQLTLLTTGLHLEVQQLTAKLLDLDQLADDLRSVVRSQLIVQVLVCKLVQILLDRFEIAALQD